MECFPLLQLDLRASTWYSGNQDFHKQHKQPGAYDHTCVTRSMIFTFSFFFFFLGDTHAIATSEEKRCKGSIRSWCKGDTMLEKHPSITCHLKPNLSLGNQVHCLDFGDSSSGKNRDMSALKESMSEERAAGNHEWANPQ